MHGGDIRVRTRTTYCGRDRTLRLRVVSPFYGRSNGVIGP